jgi:hypothetical protein
VGTTLCFGREKLENLILLHVSLVDSGPLRRASYVLDSSETACHCRSSTFFHFQHNRDGQPWRLVGMWKDVEGCGGGHHHHQLQMTMCYQAYKMLTKLIKCYKYAHACLPTRAVRSPLLYAHHDSFFRAPDLDVSVRHVNLCRCGGDFRICTIKLYLHVVPQPEPYAHQHWPDLAIRLFRECMVQSLAAGRTRLEAAIQHDSQSHPRAIACGTFALIQHHDHFWKLEQIPLAQGLRLGCSLSFIPS